MHFSFDVKWDRDQKDQSVPHTCYSQDFRISLSTATVFVHQRGMLAFRKAIAAALLVLAQFSSYVWGLYSPDVDEAVTMSNRIRHLKEPQSLLLHFVNPFLPTLLCDWHHGGKPDTCEQDSTQSKIVTQPLNTSNVGDVRPCDSVCVDVTAFESFVSTVLPFLEVKVLLLTHRMCLPSLHKSILTDAVRTHRNVAHWFSQNPLYTEDESYSAFPYGIHPKMLESFGDAFLAYHQGDKHKLNTVEQLPLSPTHRSRHKLIARSQAANNSALLQGHDFYKKIVNAQFLISPHGDRPDCYRHWEAIGLGAIPIANIDCSLFGPLFGNDMIYVDEADQMLELLDNPGQLHGRYTAPTSQRVLATFWSRKVVDQRRRCRESLNGA